MEPHVIRFPVCVRTAFDRAATIRSIKSEGARITLVVHHVGVADDADMSRLIGVLAQQRGVSKVIFRHMTFPNMQAQMALSFMSRYAPVEVAFEMCSFLHYRHCDTTLKHRCTSVEMDRCRLHSSECDDFISSVLAPERRFGLTCVARCLGGVSLISGKSA